MQKKDNLPLVTISIPTYNSSKTLLLCLEAIQNQTYKNIEINIIDGNSKDNTVQLAIEYKVEEIHSYPGSLLGARDLGVKVARGAFILFLDSDQILEKNAIERAVVMCADDNLDMLVLEEKVYRSDKLIEKLFELDRKLVHRVCNFSPFTGVVLARFYRTPLLKKAFANIPTDKLQNVGGQDHAIIYYEAWLISPRVGILADAVKHIEPNSVVVIFRKFFRWGYTSLDSHYGKYSKLIEQKERFRTGLFTGGMVKESLASILLLILKGIPFKAGYYKARLDLLRGKRE